MNAIQTAPANAFSRIAAIASLPILVALNASAQDGKTVVVAPARSQQATEKDLAGDVSRYFGQRANLYRDNNRKLAKVDLDGDFNYDGTVNNDDPADNGAFQQTPPGLVVGVGEMSKLVLRITPYKIDYDGRAKVRIQVDGINRAVKTGEFAPGAEQAGMGHVIVWRDATRKEKILDSRDPNMRSHEWTIENRTPANIMSIPRTLYVEGVTPSPAYSGDVRIILSVFDDNPALANAADADPRKWIKSFRPSFDHILLTVRAQPQPKDFVNGNAEGVWIAPKKKELPIK